MVFLRASQKEEKAQSKRKRKNYSVSSFCLCANFKIDHFMSFIKCMTKRDLQQYTSDIYRLPSTKERSPTVPRDTVKIDLTQLNHCSAIQCIHFVTNHQCSLLTWLMILFHVFSIILITQIGKCLFSACLWYAKLPHCL